MLDEKIAENVLSLALELGADFADIYVEKCHEINFSTLKSEVDKVQSGIDFGIGVRLLYGSSVLYGYTNLGLESELLDLVRMLAFNQGSGGSKRILGFEKLPIDDIHNATLGLKNDVPLRDKIDFLVNIERSAQEVNSKIIQTRALGMQKLQEIQVFNSEGLLASDSRNYIRVSSSVVAEDKGEQAQGYEAPGALMGWEFVHGLNPKDIGKKIGEQAMTNLYGLPCPAGEFPLVLSNGFGGVIFHEACGHLLETTSVEKKSSVFHDKLNQKIAHESVTAYDDGTVPTQWGSINIDDEGMKTEKTLLIENGVLKSFLVDKVGALKTGHQRTGSGRRQNYRYPPASRMRNTYIDKGTYSVGEMINSIDKGIYAKSLGGGSVTPGTGEFNFAIAEGYLIENGQIKDAVKGATLIGTGPEVLQRISMVGSDIKLSAGMCGSVSGSIPVTVGQPSLKVDKILVGGKVK